MTKVSGNTIDKSDWPDGPWKDEPDRLDFAHVGYACLLLRNDSLGQWCGYVGIDKQHPYYGKGYDDCDVDVHGGLTYAEKCDGQRICHIPASGMPDDVWWLGFDCGHFGDLSPGMLALLRDAGIPNLIPETYRTFDYVKSQTEWLAEQLRTIAG